MSPAGRMRGTGVLIALALLGTAMPAGAQTFTDAGLSLLGLEDASAAWGDYNNDGQLDIAVCGLDATSVRRTRVYRNFGGTLIDLGLFPSEGVSQGDIAWCDYDRDGDLDLAFTGANGSSTNLARIYRNDGGDVFVNVGAPLAAVRDAALAWGDVDGDGDHDLAVFGSSSGTRTGTVYRNNGGSFSAASVGTLAAVDFASAAWADVDEDGDHDLMVAGATGSTTRTATLYLNTGGTLSASSAVFSGVSRGAVDWGDFDADGDLDLLKGGLGTAAEHTIHVNTGGVFSTSSVVLQGAFDFSTTWADMDTDGDLDIACGGLTGSVGFSAVYRQNTPTSFSNISAAIPAMADCDMDWGDLDQDGDLDLMIVGLVLSPTPTRLHRVYRVSGVSVNSPPAAPTGLAMTVTSTTVTFSWNRSSDTTTPMAALSYNLWAGTASGSPDVIAPMASLANGRSRLPRIGNMGSRTSVTYPRGLFGSGEIHWGVQTVDQGFATSPFTTGPAALLDAPGASAPPRATLAHVGSHPVRGLAVLRCSLPLPSQVALTVHDTAGRLVRTLANGLWVAGEHEVRWDGLSEAGERSRPGVYLVRMRADGVESSLRIVRVE